MSPCILVYERRFCRAQYKKKEEKVDRRRGGKTIHELRNGKGWTLLAEDRTR